MGPNGYRSFLVPQVAVACITHGMPRTTDRPEDELSLVESCIHYANTATMSGRDWSNNVDEERLRRINARGIPYPAKNARHRKF